MQSILLAQIEKEKALLKGVTPELSLSVMQNGIHSERSIALRHLVGVILGAINEHELISKAPLDEFCKVAETYNVRTFAHVQVSYALVRMLTNFSRSLGLPSYNLFIEAAVIAAMIALGLDPNKPYLPLISTIPEVNK